MTKILETVNGFVWGVPTLLLILCVGIWLTVRTGFIQIRLLPRAIRLFFRKLRCTDSGDGGVSPYRALCTALAATVGTGNLAGVAGAIAIGGPGAVFWMWICAFFGMVIKYAEATLAVRYRQRNSAGEWVGGPMYMIQNGLNRRWLPLAGIYCFFGVVAAFGVGNATQVNALIGGINRVVQGFGGQETQLGNFLMGLLIAILIGFMLSGGAKRIGSIAELLVPYAALAYLVLGLGVLVVCRDAIPSAFRAIVQGAFSPKAVTGGMIGSAFSALRVGSSRGVFTNEAGMGTAAIAHGAAKVDHPTQQGLMGIMEVFIDTVVICTMTALVILCSGVQIPYGVDIGVVLTSDAFSMVYGEWVSILIACALGCFAFATVLGWGLYGARCAQFLFGDGVWKRFVVLQTVTVVLGAVLKTGTVWLLAEIVNGLMAIPNLITLALLSPELIRLTKNYTSATNGGTYENFNQRKPLRTVTYAQVPPSGGESPEGRKDHLSSEHRSA